MNDGVTALEGPSESVISWRESLGQNKIKSQVIHARIAFATGLISERVPAAQTVCYRTGQEQGETDR